MHISKSKRSEGHLKSIKKKSCSRYGVLISLNKGDDNGAGYEGVAEFYDLFANNEDLPFYLKYARKYGSPILDLAAGTGRVTFALALEGFRVTALERSPSMLNVIRQKLKRAPLEVSSLIEIVEGDMTQFSINRIYQLIIIPASFGHALTTEQQLSTLSCVRNHLHDDGVFILDLYTGGAMEEHSMFVDHPVTLPDGKTVTRSGVIDIDISKQSFELELTFRIDSPNGESEEISVLSNAAVIFNREANLLVQISEFEILDEFGGFDERPYTPDCGRRILILKKK
jgi:SAM-dependent methyltransferase